MAVKVVEEEKVEDVVLPVIRGQVVTGRQRQEIGPVAIAVTRHQKAASKNLFAGQVL